MLNCKLFFEILISNDIDFFCGVPDSLLKNFCAYVSDNAGFKKHFITANEGAAIGLASGYNIATGKYSLVYMQNSGIGNAMNPLLSLADENVYSIPLVLLIGWRGEPGVKDEPQHIKQGKVTLDMLKAVGIEYMILSDKIENAKDQINSCGDYLLNNKAPFAFIVRKGTFEHYVLKQKFENNFSLSREEAIEMVAKKVGKSDVIVSTTGMISRELYEFRERSKHGHDQDFLTVGSMGHACQIALGIALQKTNRRIFCFDGDGAILMHMGSLAIAGTYAQSNYFHIVFNNGAHDSVGGQPTVAINMDLTKIADACGYKNSYRVDNPDDFESVYNKCVENNGSSFIEIMVRKGSRSDLGRPKISPLANKLNFILNINNPLE